MNPEQINNLKLATMDTPELSLKNQKYLCKIVDVYDGDTVKSVFYFKDTLYRWNVRLCGINTPEMRPSRNKEGRDKIIENAKKSRDYLKSIFEKSNNLVYISCGGFDKYGRLLGTFFTSENDNDFENSINKTMINTGYALVY